MPVRRNRRLRLELVAAGARLSGAGLVLPGEGNLSARWRNIVWITPAGADKGRLAAGDLIPLGMKDASLPTGASSEARLHLEIYRRFPDVCAVVHAHPTAVLQLATRNRTVDVRLTAEGRSELGTVGWVGFEPPGSASLARATAASLTSTVVSVLDQHGAVAVGASVEQALRRMLLLESLARLTIGENDG